MTGTIDWLIYRGEINERRHERESGARSRVSGVEARSARALNTALLVAYYVLRIIVPYLIWGLIGLLV
jgi:hypothetical protein